jgi:hypothetical protein
LKYEKGFEELRKGVRRIRQTEVPQGVGNQQMSELVINIGSGDRMLRQHHQPQRDRQDGESQNARAGSASEFSAVTRDSGMPRNGEDDKERSERQFNEVSCGEANWIIRRQDGSGFCA